MPQPRADIRSARWPRTAQLIIDYGEAVTRTQQYTLARIDNDYFATDGNSAGA